MTKLEKIEQDVSTLTKEDLKKFSEWFDAFKADQWDAQIAANMEAGKLDKLIAEAKAQATAGKVRPL
jgi:hypothetical protein